MGNLEHILKTAQALETAEKIILVETIWDSIRQEDVPILNEAEKQEIDKRVAAYQKQPATAISWETVQAKARALLK